MQEKISDLTNNEMSFTIRPAYHILEIKRKTLLAVFIPECPDQFKPCYYKPAGMPNGAYLRDGNTDRKMTDDEMRNLIDNSKKFKFDITAAEEVSLDDLSKEKILELLIKSSERTQRQSSREEIDFKLLKNLGIADNFGRLQKPTLAGFLIFAKENPQNSFKVILMGEKLSNLNERQVKIWEYLIENKTITAKECGSLSKEVSRKTINNDLNKMEELGLIRRIGESVNRYYVTAF